MSETWDLSTAAGRAAATAAGLPVPEQPATDGSTPGAKAGPGKAMSEKAWQARVVKFARDHGWMVYHTLVSKGSEPGFPDLVLVREWVIFAELKTDRGRLTKAQKDWLEALQDATTKVYVWRPSDWDEVVRVLR